MHVGVAALLALAVTHPAPPRPLVFVLAGQSNMVGFGWPVPVETPDPRLLELYPGVGLIPATDPLFPYDPVAAPGAFPGIGPGMEFAREIAKTTGRKIILVPCAISGSGIAQWQYGQPNFSQCVARTRGAQRYGTLAGILFSQGENDVSTPDPWPGLFASFVAALRQTFEHPALPIVFSQVPATTDSAAAAFANMRAVQATVSIANVAMITVADLPYGVDPVSYGHFSPDAYKTIGQRYAAAWLTLRR